jgi:GntR family colanic acid and biofilm gene transcriptional regulator
MAVAAACGQMSNEKLATLRNLSEKFHDAMSNGEVERALHANRAFRFTLYHYADMPTLTSLIEQLWVRIGPCFNCLYNKNIDLPYSTYRYDELLAALEEGNVEASRVAIDKVIDEANEILAQQYLS